MPAHIALLRGINVGGKNLISMPALRDLFESLGFKDVKTLLQSGNIVFDGGRKSPADSNAGSNSKLKSLWGARSIAMSELPPSGNR